MNHRIGALAAALMMSVATSALAETKAPAAGAALTKVNGVAVPAALADLLVREQIAQGAPDNDDLRTRVREHLVRREVLLQAARKAGTDKVPEVQQRIAYSSGELLVNAYLERWVEKNPVTEAAARAEYERVVAQGGPNEYQSRHILVDTEEAARDIIAKLQAGTPFAELTSVSNDPGSKERGGELGWSRPGSFVPEFDAALQKLEKGQFTTEPVKTTYGFHVIQLDDIRAAEAPKFDEVKDRVIQSMQQQAVQTHVESLVSKAKVQ
ncbi:MAG: peptidylprolyl isomerase [Methyloversatilis sp.]|jgi:peptidyl-prolyl cis-trans isomerase C|nr:peptidylprolyl isomerase [Methyloversatilis sp.]